MDKAESSCSEDAENSGILEQLTRPLATRLHSRIMVSAFKYTLVSPEEDGVGERQCSQGRRKNHSVMRVCLVIFTIVTVILASALVWFWTEMNSKQEECVTAQCVDVSAYILNKMNRSVDPCVDFYSYSCGGWESQALVPPDKAKYDTFTEINTRNRATIRKLLEKESAMYKGHNSSAVAKLKVYYRTCMDMDKIQADGTGPILKKIGELGSWSISRDKGTVFESWDLVSSLVAFHKLGHAPLFAFYLTVDAKNSSHRLLAFSQSHLTLESEEEYLQTTDKFKNAFMDFAVKVGKLLGGDNSTYQKMEAIYNFEKRLAQIYVKKELLTDPLKTNNLMTVAEFQNIIGNQVDVKRMMSAILGREVGDSQVVKVPTVDYFRKLGSVLATTTPQVLQDALMWHMIQRITGFLPQAFVDAVMVLNKVERGTTGVAPRWERCVAKAQAAFGSACSALYVDKTFPPESKAQAMKILKEVQTAFTDNLASLAWMDSETEARARAKASAMHRAVGYPDWLLDPLRLDDYYQQVVVKEGEFLNNYFAVSQYETDRMWAKQDQPPDRDDWGAVAAEANAHFSSIFNQITIQAGLLQRPYFDRHFPMSFAYGAMGMISGHELTHGFDDTGRKYDDQGNLKDWWSVESSRAFLDHSQCMVDQYSAFTWDGTHLNGNFTLGEDIADNGGLKLGYAAYLAARMRGEWEEPRLPALPLTPQQLFFVGFAQIWCAYYTPEYAQEAILTDEHTINKFRVQGSVTNMPQFAEAFNCPPDAPLNSAHRCQVW
ncbi:endothelin-converting enzyme 2-like isoform X2 [Babylonia areolata]|uniref:endothelin-converting enzyme 2-like isoform X1 n=1 Tax=Babylonia areolata TaxID=304850 RepID=UPI003FD0AC1B